MSRTGRQWVDVIDAGAACDGVEDDSAVIQRAIDLLYSSYGGGVIYIPQGANCFVPEGITLKGSVSLTGASVGSSILQAWHTDVTVLTTDAAWGNAEVSRLSIYGKGTNQDSGTFGATQNAVVFNGCTDAVVRHVRVQGGYYSVDISGSDGTFDDLIALGGYGPCNVYTTGANWYKRGKFDAQYSGMNPTNRPPYPQWKPSTYYAQGTVVANSGALIISTANGSSGTSPPANRNSLVTFNDYARSDLTWQLYAPAGLVGMMFGPGASENNLWQIDLSGPYSTSLIVDSPSAYVEMRGAVASGGITLKNLAWFSLDGSHLAAPVNIDNPSGSVSFIGNCFVGAGEFNVGANVSNFGLIGNDLLGGKIIVANGASADYDIIGNRRATVINGGTGPNQRII